MKRIAIGLGFVALWLGTIAVIGSYQSTLHRTLVDACYAKKCDAGLDVRWIDNYCFCVGGAPR